MSLRESVVSAFRGTHSSLFLVGFAIVGLQAVLNFAPVRALLPAVVANVLEPVWAAVVLVATVPLAVAIYVPLVRRTTDTRQTLTCAIRALGANYPALFVANLAALVVVAATAFGAAFLWVVVGTGIRYWMYRVGDPGLPYPMRSIIELQLVFFGAFAVAALATRFADVFVVFRGRDPWTAWRDSVAFVRRRPASFVGYATLTGVLLVTPNAIAWNLQPGRRPEAVLAVTGFVVAVGSIGYLLASVVHVEYFRRMVAPAVVSAELSPVRWSRVAAAAVLLLAAVAGAGYVRTADLETERETGQTLPDDSHAAYPVAVNNTLEANHRWTLRMRNESDPGATYRTATRGGVDWDDRQAYVYVHSTDGLIAGYFGEGTLATRNGFSASSWGSLSVLARSVGNWSVLAAPGFGLVGQTAAAAGEVPDRSVQWSEVSRNESTIVYRLDAPSRIANAVPAHRVGLTEPLANDSYVEAYVDRERGVVREVQFRLHSLETGRDFSYRMRFSEVGTADLKRPREIGPRAPLEWLWDASYY